jgi:hypothetical protein
MDVYEGLMTYFSCLKIIITDVWEVLGKRPRVNSLPLLPGCIEQIQENLLNV